MVHVEGRLLGFSPNARSFGSPGLLTRPPTPPRLSETSRSGREANLSDDLDSVVASSPFTESAESRKKKVAFNVNGTKYHKEEDFGSSPLKILPRSGSTPAKSILKPSKGSPFSSNSSYSDLGIAPHTHASFASMLESITHALASNDRSRKLDTYITFCNTLNAYDAIPDMKAMRSKMPLLISFIRRDVGAKMVATEKYDSQLITQAIKLLAIFSWMPELAESIDEQDAVAFTHHAIQILQDHESPKILVNHFLYFLAHQKFPAKIITLERANAILTAVDDIDERISGNSVLMERTNVYMKLIQQNRQAMVARAADWIKNTLSTAISNNKEMRQCSLKCFTEAARCCGGEKGLYRGVTIALNYDRGDGERVITKVTEHLLHLVRNGDGAYVAQLWGTIILLIRGRYHPMSQWEHFNPWLTVIQHCFNSSVIQTKIAANSAWSKLIYVMHCPPDLQAKDLELLIRPVTRYLDPQNASSNLKHPRAATLSNICTLLYFSIRPNSNAKQLSLAWDNIVVRLVEKLVLYNRDEVDEACKILEGMFDGSTQKLWNETRCLEKDAIRPDEVPRLDPKWVRTNCAVILKTLEVAIRRASWKGGTADAHVCLLWRKFTKTLADASSKEIKVSAELMEAVANLFNMLQRLWRDGQDVFINALDKSSQAFLERFGFLIMSALESIGAFCFTEKNLAFDEEQKFIVVSTPSDRFGVSSPTIISHPPIVHLFQLFLNPFKGAVLSQNYFATIQNILSSCASYLDSRRKRIALFSACRSILPTRDPSTVHKEAWEALAQLVEASLSTAPRDRSLASTPLSKTWEFRDVFNILQWGCKHSNEVWTSLFEATVHAVKEEQGDVQVMVAIVEPISDIIRFERPETDTKIWLSHGKAVVDKASFAKAKNSEYLRSPYGLMPRKTISSEPLEHLERLCNMINQFLIAAYPSEKHLKIPHEAAEFIGSIADLVDRCPEECTEGLLKRIQEGVACWTVDSRKLLHPRDPAVSANGSHLAAIRMLRELWDSIIAAIVKLPKHDSSALHLLRVLIASGLESRIKDVVTKLITTWNTTFGTQQSLKYPNPVRVALKRLRPIADILLPTFPEDIDEVVDMSPIFLDSQESQQEYDMENHLWSSPTPVPSSAYDNRRSKAPLGEFSLSSNNFLSRLKQVPTPTKHYTPSRPKHQDSQIVFAPIAIDDAVMGVDSQLLTEHQKQVREKQHQNAALFPEMHVNAAPGPRMVKKQTEPVEPADIEEPDDMEENISVDEFVDAPEEIAEFLPNALGNVEYEEVDVIPSTLFAVEIPARTSPSKYERAVETELDEGSEIPETIQEALPSIAVPASLHEGFDSEDENFEDEIIMDSFYNENGAISRSDIAAEPNCSNTPRPVLDSIEKIAETPANIKNNNMDVHEAVSIFGVKPYDAFLADSIQVPQQSSKKYVVEIPDSFQAESEISHTEGSMTADHLDMSFSDVRNHQYEYAADNQGKSQTQDNDQNGENEHDEANDGELQVELPSNKPKGGRSRGRPRGTSRGRKRKSVGGSIRFTPEPILDSIIVAPSTNADIQTPQSTPMKNKNPVVQGKTENCRQSNEHVDATTPIRSPPQLRSRKRKTQNDPAADELHLTKAINNSTPTTPSQTPRTKKRRITEDSKVNSPSPRAVQSDDTTNPNLPTKSAPEPPSTVCQHELHQSVLDFQAQLRQTQSPKANKNPQEEIQEPQQVQTKNLEETISKSTQLPTVESTSAHRENENLPEKELNPIERLKASLAAIEHEVLDPENERIVEDLIFNTYYRLREKRRNRVLTS